MPQPSRFITSPKATEIQELILKWRHKKTWQDIYKMIKELDPNVPKFETFLHYKKRFEKEIQKRKEQYMSDADNAAVSDLDFIHGAINKAVKAGDYVLKQTLEEVESDIKEGKKIPWNRRKAIMGWFKDSGKLYLETQFLKLKSNQQMTDMAALAMLAEAARYQKVKPTDVGADIVEGDFEEMQDDRPIQQNSQSVPDPVG